MKSNIKLRGFEGMVFEGLVHLEKQFAHDGRESDLGRFAGQAESLIKLAQGGRGLPREANRAHVEGAPDYGSAAANMALPLPRTALTGPGSQSRQSGGLLPIELAQFGHLAEHAHGGQRADTVQLRQSIDVGLHARGASQGRREFFFHGGDLFFQVFDQLGLLALGKAQSRVLGVLARAPELFLKLIAPLDQGAQFDEDRIRQRCGCGRERVAIGGQDGGIQGISFSAAALRQREVPDLGGIEDADRQIRCVESGYHGAFIAASGFANDVGAADGAQDFDQACVACGSVGQGSLSVLAMELEGGFGDIQANIDGGSFFRHDVHSVRSHSCTCERVVFAAAQSTVRVTDTRHERLQLLDEHVRTVPEGNERAHAAALRPAGRRAAPSSCLACSQTRKMKATYKREKLSAAQVVAHQHGLAKARRTAKTKYNPNPIILCAKEDPIHRGEN